MRNKNLCKTHTVMKKALRILPLCLLLMALLTACGTWGEVVDILQNLGSTTPSETSKPTEPPHVCQAGDTLHMDRSNHYYTCQCGEKMNVEKHELVDQVCTVCSAKLSAEDIQGLYYLWLLDEHENVIRTQSYSDYGHTLLRTYTFEYTYGAGDKILGKKSYADGVIYDSSTWDADGNVLTAEEYDAEGNLTKAYRHERNFDENGLLLTMRTYCNNKLIYKYHISPEQRSAEEITYSENGTITSKAYLYDQTGLLAQELHYTNGVLTRKLEYTVSFKKARLHKEYIYDPVGNYTCVRYNSTGERVSRQHLDANGKPIDLSRRFDAAACAPLVGSWSGEMVLDSSMVDPNLPHFQLNAKFFMKLDEKGNMTVITTMDKEELRQTLISATMEMLREQFGRERSQEELDIIFKAEYRKSMQKYVEEYVDKQDLSEMVYKELRYFYFVEGGVLYSADSQKSLPEASPFTLTGDKLTFSDANSELSITMTKGGIAPPLPSADVEPDWSFDPNTCAPLFGVWEGTFNESDISYPDISVMVTIRLTFLEDGRVLIQRTYDPQAYYEYVLAKHVSGIYQRYEFSYNYTREQTDAEFLRKYDVTVQEYAAAQLSPLSEMLPKDYYTYYSIDTHGGELIIGYTLTSCSITANTLTIGNREAAFTKIG